MRSACSNVRWNCFSCIPYILLIFCFSRSCTPYSLRFPERPFGSFPGAARFLLIGHLSLLQRSPLRNSFFCSVLQSLHTGPVYLAIYDILLTCGVFCEGDIRCAELE